MVEACITTTVTTATRLVNAFLLTGEYFCFKFNAEGRATDHCASKTMVFLHIQPPPAGRVFRKVQGAMLRRTEGRSIGLRTRG